MKIFRFDLKGNQIGDPSLVGTIPPDGYYGKVNFTTELVSNGQNYLAVWDNSLNKSGFMEYIYARMIDSNGQPLGEAVQINQVTLDQVNHAAIYTGNGFSVFSVEQGYLQPSVDFTHLSQKDIQPTPTPVSPNATPTSTPNYTGAKLSLRAYIDGVDEVHVKGNQLWYTHFEYDLPGQNNNNNYPTYINAKEWMPTWTGNWPDPQISDIFTINPALPSDGKFYCQLLNTETRGMIVITQKPKKENDYELIVRLDDSGSGAADWYEFELGWSTTPDDTYIPPVTPYFYWKGMQRDTRETVFILKQNQCTVKNEISSSPSDPWSTVTYDLEFSGSLPLASVDLTAVMVEGNGRALVTQQPRPENDYTAVVIMMANNFDINKDFAFYVTWGNPLPPQPTVTPVPTFNPAQPSPTPDKAANKILCFTKPNDGNKYAAFDEAVKNLGLELVTIPYGEIEITPSVLQGFAAVVVGMYDTYCITPLPLTESEQAAVLQYVRSGGGLLISGLSPSDNYLNLPVQYSNSFGKLFGITFTKKITDTAGKFSTHPITTDLRFAYSDSGSILDVKEPAKAIGFIKENTPALAVAEEGYGRVVAVSSYTMFVSGNSCDSGMERPVFANNILAWLLHKEDTAIVQPTPLPKNSMVLTLTNTMWSFPRDAVFTIQGNTVTHSISQSYKPKLETVINQPLPAAPVNIEVKSLDSIVEILKINQPRSDNNYKASFTVKIDSFPMTNFNGPVVIIVTWGEPQAVTPSPTITPLPTFNPSEPSPTPHGNSAKVLWIQRSDAYTDSFQQIFKDYGATNTVLEIKSMVLSDALLSQYNTVIFGDAGNNYTNPEPLASNEQESITRFVKNGGSIFVMGYQKNIGLPDLSADYATSITKPFGINYGSLITGASTNFAAHLILSAVKAINLENASILEVSSPAEAIAFGVGNKPILAVSQYGYGRVVAFSGSEALYSNPYIPDTGIDDGAYSHKQFAANLAMWLLRKDSLMPTLGPTSTPTPTFAPANTDAQKFLNQVIDANLPWLQPKPVIAKYGIYTKDELFKTYEINENSPAMERIGSYITIPLHAVLQNKVPYEVKIKGITEYQGHSVSVINLVFSKNISDGYSLGHRNFSMNEHNKIFSAQIYVDNAKKVPLRVLSFTSSDPDTDTAVHTWEFNPEFYAVDGGYAPKDLTVYSYQFNEYQEFQVVDGYWFYKTGFSWYGNDTNYGNAGDKIQTVDLRDLNIDASAIQPTPTLRIPTSTPTVTPTPLVSSGAVKKGQVTFKADFSGELLVHIQGKYLWLEQSGTSGKPRSCWINNEVWHPEWNEKSSDSYTKLNPSLPEGDNLIYQLMPISSYTTTLVQEPKTANNHEAIILVKTKNGFNGSLNFSWKKK